MQDLHYLASITLKSGKVFALFVKSPTRVCEVGGSDHAHCHVECLAAITCVLAMQNYEKDRDKLKAIVDSFTIL